MQNLNNYKKFFDICEAKVQNNVFTAWALASENIVISSFYADESRADFEGNSEWGISLHPAFDLASLTKALFTGYLLKKYFTHNDFDTAFFHLFPTNSILYNFFIKSYINNSFTLRELIEHRAGFKAWKWFGRGKWVFSEVDFAKALFIFNKYKTLEQNKQDFYINFVTNVLYEAKEENKTIVYSDIGYFILILLLQEKGINFSDELLNINKLCGTNFSHLNLSLRKDIIPSVPYIANYNTVNSGYALYNNREYLSKIHDTNAYILHDVNIMSGHAGLFGSALDIWKFLPMLWENSKLLITGNSNKRFVMGFDTPETMQSLASPSCETEIINKIIYGHLGYTGTSFWFKTDNDKLLKRNIFLTNRTAKRTEFSSVKCPRLCIITKNNDNYYYVLQNNKWHEITKNDTEEIIIHYSNNVKLYNDTHCFKSLSNINDLRILSSQLAWSD